VTTRVAVVFPGQGGIDMCPADLGPLPPELAAELGSIEQLFADGPPTRTDTLQAAVFALGYVAWLRIADVLGRAGVEPVAFAGHSLGQLTALAASGAVEPADVAGLVAARGEATRRCTERERGVMAAVSGMTLAEITDRLTGRCWVANDNAPRQVVVAGAEDDVRSVAAPLADRPGVRVTPLPIAGAFHTPMMAAAQPAVDTAARSVRFRPPAAPLYSNIDAAPLTAGSWPDVVADHLVRPVRWRQSVQAFVAAGVDVVLVAGPGPLAGLVRRCAPDLPVVTVASLADQRQVEAALARQRPLNKGGVQWTSTEHR
jgi:[acyl-carrier-protein] S-malonyltransferase